MPHFRVWYARETPGWGGGVRGPIRFIEAPDAECAQDDYLREVFPLVWRRHWAGQEEGEDVTEDAYYYHLEGVEVVRVPGPMRLVERRKGEEVQGG